jgi:hypothetical protein
LPHRRRAGQLVFRPAAQYWTVMTTYSGAVFEQGEALAHESAISRQEYAERMRAVPAGALWET